MPHSARAIYWVGTAGSKSWQTPANWSTSRNGSGGNGVGTPDAADTGIPETGDSVYVIDGYSSIDTGLTNTTNLALLHVTFGGSIGTSSSSLALGTVTAAKINGTGPYINLSATFTTLNVVGGNVVLSGGTTTNLYTGDAGHLSVEAAAVVTNYKSGGMGSEIAYNSTPITLADISGGSHKTSRTITGGLLDGGATLETKLAADIGSGGLKVGSGSKFIHNGSVTSFTGTIAGLSKSVAMIGDTGPATLTVTTVEYTDSEVFVGSGISKTTTPVGK